MMSEGILDRLRLTKARIVESIKRVQQREDTGFRVDRRFFPKLSDLVGCIRDSVVVGGVAGHGKSQFVQQMAIHGALDQNKVLYCDFENPIEELHKTILIKLANVVNSDSGSGPTIDDLMKGPEKIADSVEAQLESLGRYFYILKPTLIPAEYRRLTFDELLGAIVLDELAEIPGKDTIVVIDSFDELFKMQTPSPRSMTEIADLWVERLRSVKEEHGATMILVCEYTKADQKYKEYSAKWSSSIGHFARLSLFLSKSERKEGQRMTLNPAIERRSLEVVRNQYGAGTGEVPLLFDTSRLIFREATENTKVKDAVKQCATT